MRSITASESPIFAFCVCDETQLEDVWQDIERELCSRSKHTPPLILIDVQRALFENDGIESEQFVEHFNRGVWADLIRKQGKLAVVIGSQENVCVAAKLELLEAFAELSNGSDNIRLLPSTKLAMRWLASKAPK